MLVNIQDDIIELHKIDMLEKLLQDKTTKGNILWGTDEYKNNGKSYQKEREIIISSIMYENKGIIKARARKIFEEQAGRTKRHGEVFTPLIICNKMIDYIDTEWFEIKKLPDSAWEQVEELFKTTNKDWKKYVDNKRLEITCGEAPYLVQRYDVESGEMMPVEKRRGILDRKLHVVNQFATTKDEWTKQAIRAFESTYGYEFQGDNLLIARVNFVKTFMEYYENKWNEKTDIKTINKIVNTVTWNLWQMDGLTDCIPCYKENMEGMTLFEYADNKEEEKEIPVCKIFDWKNTNKSFEYREMKGRRKGMKFDYVIGNPPYQEESKGNNESDTPVYHFFMDEAFKVADKVELITPARFLFNVGKTPKAWNNKMLNDEHFKVMFCEMNSTKVFPNTDIKGGIAITYRDKNKNFGEIELFFAYDELKSIKEKVDKFDEKSLSEIISSRGIYRYSEKAYEEVPDEMSKTSDSRIAPSAFERMSSLFTDDKPLDGHEYVQILGSIRGVKCYKWFRRDYLKEIDNLHKYKVIISKANGSGAIGEVLSTPLIGEPLIGVTETFITVGETLDKREVEAVLKYIKSKFARTMLGILKVTQNNSKQTWKYVPLQDFNENSDIDWSQSVSDIDKQLYKKYGLSDHEISFIETHVKEMK